MPGGSFLDTNVLLYLDATDAPEKQATARVLWERLRRSGEGVISTQVLQEYYAAATRKLGVRPDIARRRVDLWATLRVLQVNVPMIRAAIVREQRDRLSFWDALIVEAAVGAGCETLFSEDLQTGRRFEQLLIVNPFAGD
ncbi:putative nucleic acid-binding protein [Constrictibacter sp. MBR-5]|jgi:predicted nucleic acid-binding protein|uniref:PIN domain-containing protein n=1 Tax=Constrictibacter sp. MBR-5 TaxID=3156467 RepID=UPI003391A29E